MTLNPGKVIYFLLISLAILLFSGCSNNASKDTDEHIILDHEKQLQNLLDELTQQPDNSDPNDLLEIYNEMLPLLEALPDISVNKARAHAVLAQKLSGIYAYREALDHSWKAIRLSKQSVTPDSNAFRLAVYGKLADIYRKLGSIDSEMMVRKMATGEATLYKNSFHLAAALNNVGYTFYLNNHTDSAMTYYLKADRVLNESSTKNKYAENFHGIVLNNIARIYEDQGRYQKARDIYQNNVSRYDSLNNTKEYIHALLALANVNLKLDNVKESKILLSKALSCKDTSKYDNSELNQGFLLQVLTRYHEKSGNHDSALLYSEKLLQFKDGINTETEQYHERATVALSQFVSQRFKDQMLIETTARESENQRSRLYLWIIVLIGLGATITPTILFYYYRQRVRLQSEKNKLTEMDKSLTQEKLRSHQKEKKLLDLQLEHKKKELMSLAIHLANKQIWAKDIVDKLNTIQETKGYKKQKAFRQLKEEIRSQIQVDDELAHLQQNIAELTSEFYAKLNDRFSDLTKTDIQMCSYIKLNLSNKQIANLQNIDTASVKMSRYRLKKKLKLSTEDDLNTFLQSI